MTSRPSSIARAVSATVLLAAVGCFGSDPAPDDGSITIDPLQLSVAVGDTAVVKATVSKNYGAVSQDWLVSDTSKARIVRSDATGRVVLRRSAPGSTALVYTLTAGVQNVIGSIPVTVTAR